MTRGKKDAGPNAVVSLPLSEEERDLILNETFVSDEILRRLRLASLEEGRHVYKLTPDDIEDLLDALAFAANHAENQRLQRRLDRLSDRLEKIMSDHGFKEEVLLLDEEDLFRSGLMLKLLTDGPRSDKPSSDFFTEVERFVRKMDDYESIEDLEDALRDFFRENVPDDLEETGKMSPARFSRLVSDTWDGEGVVRLNHGLSLDEIRDVELLANARGLLKTILERGGVKATAKGNLPRKFVLEMLEALAWPVGFVEELRRYYKVINEMDAFPLHVLRIVLELSHVLRLAKGVFKVAKKHQALLKKEMAGRLYALLFRTHFMEFNLAYLDQMDDVPMVQETISYPLYMLSLDDGDWKRPDDLAHRIMVPPLITDSTDVPYLTHGAYLVNSRIIDPLLSFGLLERRTLPSDKRIEVLKSYEVRKTELFDKFIKFVFD